MHYLEKALIEAIKAKKLQDVKNIVKSIYDSEDASLTCCNEDNETLLHVTHYENFPEAFDLLFEELKEDKSCLAQADSKGNNILHLIAKSGSLEMINKINSQIEASWLVANKQGQTPLHLVANKNPPALLAVLIRHLPKEVNAVHTLINFIDNNNDTALSIARTYGIVENMAMLINHGAVIGESVVASIRNNSDLVFGLFSQLEEKKKKYFVDAWRQLVINHQGDENIKAIYFRLAGMQSLEVLLQAHFEFNNKVFSLYSENKDKVIPNFILSADFMPAYFRERLNFAKKNNKGAVDKALEQDINTLNQLCQQIETQISDLKYEKQSASSKGQIFFGATFGLALIISLGGMVLIAISPFVFPVLIIALAGAIVGTLAVIASVTLFGSLLFLGGPQIFKPTISPDRSLDLRIDIEAKILSHLQDLEKNNIASLPVFQYQIRELENTVSQLADPKDRDVDEEVSLLTELKNRLEKMANELIIRGKPITQVVEDESIEEELVEENNEVIIDIPGSSPAFVSRYGMFAKLANQPEETRRLLLDDTSDDDYTSRKARLGGI